MKLGGGIETLNVEFEDDKNNWQVKAKTEILTDEDGYIISGKWECENGITVELVDNVLTISGKGVLGTAVKDIINKTICVSNKYKVECIIGSGITDIEPMIFINCRGLGSVKIPDSVISIGYYAFDGCSSLNNIKVAEENKVYDSRENCNAIIKTETNELIRGCSNTKIPNSVTSIGDEAFRFCSSLNNIEIPNSVTSIGYYAFSNCSNLTRITNNSSEQFALNAYIHYSENGQWYLENTDTIIDKIANGQTAIYKKIGEDGKPIEDVKYGDINSDGEINIQDGVLLKKHLAGIKGLNIDMTASDVNVDSEVNIQDAVILMKYLAGMNVTLGKESL